MAGGDSFVPLRHRLPASVSLPLLLLLQFRRHRCCYCCSTIVTGEGDDEDNNKLDDNDGGFDATQTRDRPSHSRRSTGKQSKEE